MVPAVGCDGDTELRFWTPKLGSALHDGQAVRRGSAEVLH